MTKVPGRAAWITTIQRSKIFNATNEAISARKSIATHRVSSCLYVAPLISLVTPHEQDNDTVHS